MSLHVLTSKTYKKKKAKESSEEYMFYASVENKLLKVYSSCTKAVGICVNLSFNILNEMMDSFMRADLRILTCVSVVLTYITSSLG